MRTAELIGIATHISRIPTPDCPLLSLRQAAAYLGMSDSGLRKITRKRRIRFAQQSRWSRIKFRREWLDEFIEATSVTPVMPVPKARQPSKQQQTTLPLGEKSHGLDYRLLST